MQQNYPPSSRRPPPPGPLNGGPPPVGYDSYPPNYPPNAYPSQPSPHYYPPPQVSPSGMDYAFASQPSPMSVCTAPSVFTFGDASCYSNGSQSVSSRQSSYFDPAGAYPPQYPFPNEVAPSRRMNRVSFGSTQDMRATMNESADGQSVNSYRSAESEPYGNSVSSGGQYLPAPMPYAPQPVYSQAPTGYVPGYPPPPQPSYPISPLLPPPQPVGNVPYQQPPAYMQGPPQAQSSLRRGESMYAMQHPEGRPPLSPYSNGPPLRRVASMPVTTGGMPPMVPEHGPLPYQGPLETSGRHPMHQTPSPEDVQLEEALMRSLDEEAEERKRREMKQKALEAANDAALRIALEESAKIEQQRPPNNPLAEADEAALQQALRQSALEARQKPKSAVDLANEEALRLAIELSMRDNMPGNVHYDQTTSQAGTTPTKSLPSLVSSGTRGNTRSIVPQRIGGDSQFGPAR